MKAIRFLLILVSVLMALPMVPTDVEAHGRRRNRRPLVTVSPGYYGGGRVIVVPRRHRYHRFGYGPRVILRNDPIGPLYDWYEREVIVPREYPNYVQPDVPHQPTVRERGPVGGFVEDFIGTPLEHIGDAVGGALGVVGRGLDALGGIERPSGPPLDHDGQRWCAKDDGDCRERRGAERGAYKHRVSEADRREREAEAQARRTGNPQYVRPEDTLD